MAERKWHGGDNEQPPVNGKNRKVGHHDGLFPVNAFAASKATQPNVGARTSSVLVLERTHVHWNTDNLSMPNVGMAKWLLMLQGTCSA
jgi:hypothetical protein